MEINVATNLTLSQLIHQLAVIANNIGADSEVYAQLLTDVTIIAQDADKPDNTRFRFYWGISLNGTEIKYNRTILEKWANKQQKAFIYRITHEKHNCYSIDAITE